MKSSLCSSVLRQLGACTKTICATTGTRPHFPYSAAKRSFAATLQEELPRGFQHTQQAVSEAAWTELKEWLETEKSIPWETAIEGRRVVQWGCRYDYDTQAVDPTPIAEIPALVRRLFPQAGSEFTQCIINEYGANDGIPFHMDDLAFGPNILVFCFGDERPLLLQRINDDEDSTNPVLSVNVGHLGSYTLSGEARYNWKHSIPTGLSQRLSVTFRSLAS
eukprot:TRINITY_DN101432_c0_g1_i1.p1 TRINITY_DN101432_c0_g1~~TRINITY_DN101432_c0_g1_i1.p1  ORF type:complete len:220 (+),score=21.77 TRINITY_DN101432_c0_g1_i1:20-679(+)